MHLGGRIAHTVASKPKHAEPYCRRLQSLLQEQGSPVNPGQESESKIMKMEHEYFSYRALLEDNMSRSNSVPVCSFQCNATVRQKLSKVKNCAFPAPS